MKRQDRRMRKYLRIGRVSTATQRRSVTAGSQKPDERTEQDRPEGGEGLRGVRGRDAQECDRRGHRVRNDRGRERPAAPAEAVLAEGVGPERREFLAFLRQRA